MVRQLRSRVAAVTFVLSLVLMVSIPTVRYLAGDESRFGWQMFSYADRPPTFTVVTQGDTRVSIELDDHLAFLRAGLDLVDALPPHLCEQIPGATAVEVDDGEAAREFSC